MISHTCMKLLLAHLYLFGILDIDVCLEFAYL